MADIEKVIKGLECCKAIHIYLCNDCPYYDDHADDNNCKGSLCADALELLKEKEVTTDIEGGGMTWYFCCDECRTSIRQEDKYCRMCGRKIKWV